MLESVGRLREYRLGSDKGDIGRVDDIVFPRGQWVVRYLVASMERPRRQALFPVACLGALDGETRKLRCDLQRELIEATPELDLTKQIDRRDEEQVFEAYGWPPYWMQGEQEVTPTGMLSGEPAREEPADQTELESPELQLARDVTGGFVVHSNEGEFGLCSDFVIDDDAWTIRYITVDSPLEGRGILVETDWVSRIDWVMKEMYLGLPHKTIAGSPTLEAEQPVTNELERTLHHYYERIRS